MDNLYFSISTVPAATYFYGIGYLTTSERIEKLAGKLGKWLPLLTMLLLTLPLARLCFFHDSLLMFACQFEIVDFIIAPLASVGIMLFAIQIAKLPAAIRNIFVWLGQNTMMIMAIHSPIMWLFAPMRFVMPFSIFKILEQALMWLGSYISAVLANKYAPWLIGKTKFFSK